MAGGGQQRAVEGGGAEGEGGDLDQSEVSIAVARPITAHLAGHGAVEGRHGRQGAGHRGARVEAGGAGREEQGGEHHLHGNCSLAF